MSSPDPHIHVDVRLNADAVNRGRLAATFGLAADLPARSTTGCGTEVPYVMTSINPSKVTCLPCREHAHRRFLELAGTVEQVNAYPGMSSEVRAGAALAADEYRDLARRFKEA